MAAGEQDGFETSGVGMTAAVSARTTSAAPSQVAPRLVDADLRTDQVVRLGATAVLWLGLLLVTYWWRADGGVTNLAGLASGLTSVGRLTGLWAADLLLFQVLLMSRLPPLENAFGRDQLVRTHRVVGFLSVDPWVQVVVATPLSLECCMAADRELRRRFWLLVRAGAFAGDAARALGVVPNTGERWFRDAGGMPPMSLDPPATRRYLCLAEREQIHAGISAGLSIRAIARGLGRAPSTVWRELRANMFHQQYRSRRSLSPHSPGAKVRVPWKYSPSWAQGHGERARARPKVAKLAGNDRLHDQVQDWLEEKYSPEQISHRLRCDFAQDPEMRVSHETIYQSLYVQGRGALRRDLTACLRTGRTLRRPRRRPGERRERITDMVNIAERPPEVDDRRIPGHWEGDLIVGANSGSAIGTLVERTTGFVILLHLPDTHGATQVADQMITQMSRLPDLLRKSVTWDQGIEMSQHARISLATDLDIFFCDPHSPWQRGSNENTNGLLRQYFPKGTDLSGYHPDYLDYVAAQLNDRPRKRHNWQTPREVLTTLLDNPTPPTVATTT